MREIKFRAWHKTRKAFMYFELGELNDSMITKIDDGWYLEDCELMQYTGLKDKNGKEMYEGDIVKCYNGIVNTYFNSVIEWEITDIQDDISDFPLDVAGFIIGSLGKVEVIGNRYENPELLEVK